ncbi:hypothetical protein [Xanthomonas sp. NCPPB 2632]|uniref:hypothetical protein n=1 Tax=Xanthomonas sp. NCPPB 2632 TaxID=3240912 RepID=UPI00351694BC
MTAPLPALLAALNRAIEGVERNDDPWLRSIAITALQRELGDLGYRVPVDPDIALPLQRIASMVADLHAGRSAPPEGDASPVEPLGSLTELRKAVGDCSTLTICDPYLLQGLAGISPQAHVIDLDAALPPGLTQLEIFVKPGKRHPTIATGLHEVCASRGIALIHRLTQDLHDRVWVFDHRRAFAIGASFNGLVDRCAFIVELPREARDRFLGKLKALRPNARWAPGVSKGSGEAEVGDTDG